MRAMHVFRAAAVTMIATLVTATALYAAEPATGATTDRTTRWENHLQQKLGLTEDQLNAWMGAVNDLRLVLGTRLDVTEDMDAVQLDDPRAPAFAVYQYLTHLLSEIVNALSG